MTNENLTKSSYPTRNRHRLHEPVYVKRARQDAIQVNAAERKGLMSTHTLYSGAIAPGRAGPDACVKEEEGRSVLASRTIRSTETRQGEAFVL